MEPVQKKRKYDVTIPQDVATIPQDVATIPRGVATLSVKQPAAALILYRGKNVENRSHGSIFAKNGRIFQNGAQWILIHAGKARQKPEPMLSDAILTTLQFKDTAAAMEGVDQETGAVVGAALISAQQRPEEPCQSIWASDGEYHIIIEDVIAFSTPQAFKGRLGLFPIDWNILSDSIQSELQHVKDAFMNRTFPKPKLVQTSQNE